MPVVSTNQGRCEVERYRDATLRLAKLPGVTRPSFRCRKCGKSRGVNGRRQVVRGTSRFGYHCASCAPPAQPAA